MHQALTSEPTGQSPRKVALRSLAVAFFAVLLVFLQARLSRDLQIVFDLRVERPGPYQLYLADDQGNFSERLNYTRSTRAGEWQRHTINVNTLRKVTQVRMDPTTMPGRVDFGALDGFTTDGADPMKAGAELFRTLAAMESALSVVARPGGEPFDDFAARELDPYGLIGLFVWYFEAMTPGEAQPSLT